METIDDPFTEFVDLGKDAATSVLNAQWRRALVSTVRRARVGRELFGNEIYFHLMAEAAEIAFAGRLLSDAYAVYLEAVQELSALESHTAAVARLRSSLLALFCSFNEKLDEVWSIIAETRDWMQRIEAFDPVSAANIRSQLEQYSMNQNAAIAALLDAVPFARPLTETGLWNTSRESILFAAAVLTTEAGRAETARSLFQEFEQSTIREAVIDEQWNAISAVLSMYKQIIRFQLNPVEKEMMGLRGYVGAMFARSDARSLMTVVTGEILLGNALAARRIVNRSLCLKKGYGARFLWREIIVIIRLNELFSARGLDPIDIRHSMIKRLKRNRPSMLKLGESLDLETRALRSIRSLVRYSGIMDRRFATSNYSAHAERYALAIGRANAFSDG